MAVVRVVGDVSSREVNQVTNVLMLSEGDIAGVRVGVNGEAEDLVDAGRVSDGVTLAHSRKKVRHQMLLRLINKDAEVVDVHREANVEGSVGGDEGTNVQARVLIRWPKAKRSKSSGQPTMEDGRTVGSAVDC